MAIFLDSVVGNRTPLWLDYIDYAGRLLAGDRIPWLDITAFIAWQRKAQGLLKADVVVVPLAPLAAAWLVAHPQLGKAMAEKKRALFPIKTLLADTALRAHLVELAAGLRSSFAKLPLALVLPSPRRWIALAYEQVAGNADDIDIGEDEIDSAAVYVADFLRAFGETGVDTVLLEEAADHAITAAEIGLYQPVINVAAHYRWSLGVQFAGAACAIDIASGLGFIIADKALDGIVCGIATPAAFWSGGDLPECAPGSFRFAKIPADTNPEKVLDLLIALRS